MWVKGMVMGVGINDAGYNVKDCPYHRRWSSMMKRCYGGQWPAYDDCFVTKEWLMFSNFKKWMENQNWEGKELDKDILFHGNKEYGPNTCIFVSKKINDMVSSGRHPDKEYRYPAGVKRTPRPTKNKGHRYESYLYINSQKIYVGTYDTIKEAAEAWKEKKSNHFLEHANNLTSENTSDIKRTKEALIKRAKLILE